MNISQYKEMMWGLVNSIDEIFDTDEPFVDAEERVDHIVETIKTMESLWNSDGELSNKDFEKIALIKFANMFNEM